MGFLDSTSQSTNTGPTRLGIYSVEGYGKTTLLAHFPRPIFLCGENGIPRDLPFQVAMFIPRTWQDVLGFVGELIDKPHDYLTLCGDTVDWLEPLIHRFICERDSGRQTEMNEKGRKLESIEDYGYGKGYIAAEEEFRKFISLLDFLQSRRGMHIAMAMHAHVKNFKNPGGADFDRYEPKAHTRIARVVVEWAENFLFGFFEMDAGKIGDEKKAKGVSSGKRILGTRQSAMYNAKNRIRLAPEIELLSPSDLIPILLGHHIAEAAPQYVGPAADMNREHERRQREEFARNERERVAQEAREAEAARQADADAAAGRAARLAQSADPGKTESRNWTEPQPSRSADTRAAYQDPTPTRGPNNDPPYSGQPPRERTIHDDVADALAKAERVMGAVYTKKVAGWVEKAGGDPLKLKSIITEVDKVTAAQTAQK